MSDTQQEEAEVATLGLGDLKLAVEIFDYAANQGIFKGWKDILGVKALRDRYEAFYIHAKAQQEAQEAEEAAAKAVTAQLAD